MDYRQIADDLATKIRTGGLTPGAQLTSYIQLADTCGHVGQFLLQLSRQVSPSWTHAEQDSEPAHRASLTADR